MNIFPFLVLCLSLTVFAESEKDRKARSIEYFNQAAKVFQHPRCLNCHPAGERPTVGLDMSWHNMNVKRGPDDHGVTGMRCNTCHQDKNNSYTGVPGAPGWGVAPKEMAWQGLSKKELCERLKNSKSTHRTLQEMIEHNAHDELVGWGWKPGNDLEPAPFTQEKFGEIFRQWVDTGAECPEN